MHLSDITQACQFRISEGYDYLWECFGDLTDTHALEFRSVCGSRTVTVAFNRNDQRVFEVNVALDSENMAFRWIDPDYVDAVKLEYLARGLNFKEAWDECRWIDVDEESDILDKAQDAIDGIPVDPRVVVPLDLDNDSLLSLALMAHERDITLNEFINEALKDELSKGGWL